eukprot:14039705-Alexandrium_andersonii.AAC.1
MVLLAGTRGCVVHAHFLAQVVAYLSHCAIADTHSLFIAQRSRAKKDFTCPHHADPNLRAPLRSVVTYGNHYHLIDHIATPSRYI